MMIIRKRVRRTPPPRLLSGDGEAGAGRRSASGDVVVCDVFQVASPSRAFQVERERGEGRGGGSDVVLRDAR
jgi:hypothetical protein